ncbi:unnamed protein product, partial [Amoebophrya sp. A25]
RRKASTESTKAFREDEQPLLEKYAEDDPTLGGNRSCTLFGCTLKKTTCWIGMSVLLILIA